MEQQLSDVLDNLLGLLLLEGSYEIEEEDEVINVLVETPDAARLIGARGESLQSLQLVVNQIISQKVGREQFKRVIIDVAGWRKQKEEELTQRSQEWAKEVLESKKDLELEPMPSWQRRIVHMVVSETEGVESESIGEGRDRHIVIKLKTQNSKRKTEKNKNEDVEASET
ncbi:MAG: R3H domain-containing nucleic acid-binding protein [Candidatus Daviesbacteria bacterium]|nr:R3H domain-containing nucleic acid-binding protein [Candidatus Daviesbacteria bacterium]